MKQAIYVKDEDGLYDKDPKQHPDAKLFGKITLEELSKQMPSENILDLALYEAFKTAKTLKRVVIVNGLKHGQLTAALRGEDVGTVIVKEDA
jgi:molybdenum storage protein